MEKIKTWLESRISLYTYENSQEEKLNSWTHLFGALLSVAGIFLLLRSGLIQHRPHYVWAFAVFGFTMLMLFSASGFYHLLKPSIAKRIFRVLDHSNIYFLIAGTYTPILTAINNPLSRKLLVLIWLIALLGVTLKLIFWDRMEILHLFFYLAMGWMALLLWTPMKETIPMNLIKYIFLGGGIYTTGVLFYAIKKIPYNHAIWHLFVLGGCGSFFWGFFKYLPVA